MRNLLRKLSIMSSQSDCSHGSSKGSRLSDMSPSRTPLPPSSSHHLLEEKPLTGLSGLLSSVTSNHNSASSCNSIDGEDGGACVGMSNLGDSEVEPTTERHDPELRVARVPELDEDNQIKLALELSAKEDPEAAQIEAVKQISLGSLAPQNTPAEVVAHKYWNYNSLSYDDKILDGFYDIYGVLSETTSPMPSLVDLQQIPVFETASWEAVLVNRVADADLWKLEERALLMAVESGLTSIGFEGNDLVQKLASMVAEYMGGPVRDPGQLLQSWRNLTNLLQASGGTMVLCLGQLRIGLARHRALLFKVLADSVGVPCQLMKGMQFTGSDDVAMNIVKINDGREYIVDLMADPGTLIPADTAGLQIEYEEPSFLFNPSPRDADGSQSSSFSSGMTSSVGFSENGLMDGISRSGNFGTAESLSCEQGSMDDSVASDENQILKSEGLKSEDSIASTCECASRVISHTHTRCSSWTEGVSLPTVHGMKVKGVSQYMIDAAKENPHLVQKLHDLLLESVAAKHLSTKEKAPSPVLEKSPSGDASEKNISEIGNQYTGQDRLPLSQYTGIRPKWTSSRAQIEQMKPAEGLGIYNPLELGEVSSLSSQSEASASVDTTLGPPTIQQVKHFPVAAAAATAAVVASSMVVAVTKSNTDSKLKVPVAAAATATAAAVIATTAAVSRQCEQWESQGHLMILDSIVQDQHRSNQGQDGVELEYGHYGMAHQGGERTFDKSTGNDTIRSDPGLEDMAEWEIPWEEIMLSERIGLGSYGEVYHGDWHGTEVAVKKFLEQDISGDALEEFKSEVRIIKRLRHPNVVLFMGAVTRVPNLSIVTEFLPRGSLYRLIHRTSNQLDERKRMKMALDVARGMNYLHSCSPIIVHRDLKSPNLLVDRNWVVKVCDFGLSRMKQNTFLSSRSTAGTAEWMAPEVLRNEPSDEKCDVYSFGIILWELSTLQQPWGGMNPMQVVGAVGFQHRRLDIPDDMDPAIANIIKNCWQTDPKRRPSFAEIIAALKPMQKPATPLVSRPRITSAQVGDMR